MQLLNFMKSLDSPSGASVFVSLTSVGSTLRLALVPSTGSLYLSPSVEEVVDSRTFPSPVSSYPVKIRVVKLP